MEDPRLKILAQKRQERERETEEATTLKLVPPKTMLQRMREAGFGANGTAGFEPNLEARRKREKLRPEIDLSPYEVVRLPKGTVAKMLNEDLDAHDMTTVVGDLLDAYDLKVVGDDLCSEFEALQDCVDYQNVTRVTNRFITDDLARDAAREAAKLARAQEEATKILTMVPMMKATTLTPPTPCRESTPLSEAFRDREDEVGPLGPICDEVS